MALQAPVGHEYVVGFVVDRTCWQSAGSYVPAVVVPVHVFVPH